MSTTASPQAEMPARPQASLSTSAFPVKEICGYRDYSSFTPGSQPEAQIIENDSRLSHGKKPRGTDSNFPAKLHDILSQNEYSSIITWMPHGRSWRVEQPVAFVEKLAQMFFSQKKYSSFNRQVTGWGFRRLTKGPDKNTYYHELFLRGMPHLTKLMRRPPSAKKKKHVSDPQNEPNFCKISQEFPLPENRPPLPFLSQCQAGRNICSISSTPGSLFELGNQPPTNRGFYGMQHQQQPQFPFMPVERQDFRAFPSPAANNSQQSCQAANSQNIGILPTSSPSTQMENSSHQQVNRNKTPRTNINFQFLILFKTNCHLCIIQIPIGITKDILPTTRQLLPPILFVMNLFGRKRKQLLNHSMRQFHVFHN